MSEGTSPATVRFETDRLLIRDYDGDDADFALDMYGRPEMHRFLPSSLPWGSRDQARGVLERWRGVGAQDPVFGVWLITLRADATSLGTLMLKRIPLSADVSPLLLSEDIEVGWHLHPDHWGHGYVTEAATAAIRRGFSAGLADIIALILPGNVRSVAVAERIGMTERGITDRYYNVTALEYAVSASS